MAIVVGNSKKCSPLDGFTTATDYCHHYLRWLRPHTPFWCYYCQSLLPKLGNSKFHIPTTCPPAKQSGRRAASNQAGRPAASHIKNNMHNPQTHSWCILKHKTCNPMSHICTYETYMKTRGWWAFDTKFFANHYCRHLALVNSRSLLPITIAKFWQ